MIESPIIKSMKLDPLLVRAGEVAHHYETAADCTATVLGPNLLPVKDSKKEQTTLLCQICKRCGKNGNASNDTHPCAKMHIDAVKDAQNRGGSYIYTCDVGLLFWTSPLYSGGHFAGALVAGGFLGIKRQEALERIYKKSQGVISHDTINRCLDEFPEKNYEDVKALAQMMLACANQISKEESKPLHAEMQVFPENSNNAEKERVFMASLRRGDVDEARKMLGEMMEAVRSGGDLASLRLQATELVVLISRAAIKSEGEDPAVILETNNHYLKKIEEAQRPEEILDVLETAMDRMAAKLFSFRGIRHSTALRKAERFIWENYSRKISLDDIAQAAGLSAPYFSTVFKEEMGENLSSYLNRLRVKNSAARLTETTMPIKKIAAACGFVDQNWFSKIFKHYTGLTPGKFREKGGISPMTEHIVCEEAKQ